MLKTVTAYREAWQAHMFQARLEAEDIPAYIEHQFHVGNAWHLSTGLGGVKVQVTADRLENARHVARQCADGEFRTLLDTELGDLDDLRCPKCAAKDFRKRRPLARTVLALGYSLLIGPICPPIGWIYYCKTCGTRFMPRPAYAMRKWVAVAYVMPAFLVVLFGSLYGLNLIANCYGNAGSAACQAARTLWPFHD